MNVMQILGQATNFFALGGIKAVGYEAVTNIIKEESVMKIQIY